MSEKTSDPYAILGVSPDDDDRAIKHAFRRKSLNCHPDMFPDNPSKTGEFRDLREAYEQVDTADKRRKLRQRAGAVLSRGAEGAVASYFARVYQVEEGGR